MNITFAAELLNNQINLMKVLKYLYGCLMVAVCLGFAACGDDDDVDVSASDLYGTWSITTDEYTYKENGKLIQEESGTDIYEDGEWTLTFNEDGTFVENDEGYSYYGTWTLKGNELVMTDDDGDADSVTIIEYNGNRAVVESRYTYTDEGVKCEEYDKMTLKKIG